jgi:hypothetical protein
MNDTTCKIQEKEIENKKIKIRQIKLNNKIVELVKLGDIAESFGGVKAYEGIYDDFMRTTMGGRYGVMDFSLLNSRLTETEKLNGIDDNNKKIYVNMMKFGDHVIDDLILNYNDFIDHYFPWNKKLIKKLDKLNSLRNRNKYFSKGIFFSIAGEYTPCFRFAKYDLFDINSHLIDFKIKINQSSILGILASKTVKYFLKNYLNHSAALNTQDIDEMPIIILKNNETIGALVDGIIEKQRQNSCYDYMSNEQKEIDKLVYEMYGLNKDDIREVEIWYARRYPKLAKFCDID